MALNIRNEKAERLAAELASLTGETKTEAVIKSLSDRLQHLRRTKNTGQLVETLDEISRHCAALPLLDQRSNDEILYDAQGLPR